jgi:enhancing lycopene biosynthesis protein 2
MKKNKKIAVILCGSGFKDGSEIRESVSVLLALDQQGAKVKCFAPDEPQADVVDCLSGQVMKSEKRNMIVEAARIARGEVYPLVELNVDDFDGVIIPGGFGVAKNLCNFAAKGTQAEVHHLLQTLLHKFHAQNKMIGAVCIAPVILALAFKDKKFTMTLGPSSEASMALEKLGHHHKTASVTECVVDAKNKIITSPAYMIDEAPLADIYKGIEALVKEVLKD